jgi:lysophospholipase L1-like esterase
MNLKNGILSLGWVLFIILVALIASALSNPNLADNLLWRFELSERQPSLTQRSFEHRMQKHSLYVEQGLKLGTPLFFGDSHLQLIPPDGSRWAANFGIGGQTMKRMVENVPKFKSISTASVVFINGGENDLLAGDSVESISGYWQNLLDRLPKVKNLVCVGLPEADAPRVNASQVKLLNERISDVCRRNDGKFLAIQIGVGEFKLEHMASDNLHLSWAATQKLARLMEKIAFQSAL